jgi:hypothetical protein
MLRMATRRSLLVIAASAILPRAQAGAQAGVPGTPSLPPTTLPVEQRVNDRWLHGGQQARFTEFTWHHDWMFVDSTRATDTERRLYITLDHLGKGAGSALIIVGPAGQVEQLHVTPTVPGRELPLAGTRLWDFALTFPSETPRIGLAWTDIMAHLALDGSSRQSLRGSRVSRIAGDTVIGGRRLWVVHDSAAVDYEEGYVQSPAAQVSRTARGTIRGVHVYDPDIHLVRWREDTTRLVGEAVLRYPDGRSLRTPARYERYRRVNVFDAATYSAVIAERRAAANRATGGMVIAPSSDVERRLSAGDAAATDSIIRAWQHTTDPYEAVQLYNVIAMWGRDPARRRLDDLRVSAGDTAFLAELLARRAYSRDAADTADMRAMIRFMDDPSIAWRFNVPVNGLEEDLVQALTTWPRAAAVGFPGMTVSCTVAACRLLGDQWTSAHEARLRDVGLVALLSVDPRRWADTVLALDGPQHPLLRAAAQLVNGVGATWPAASKAPLPPPNSDWRAWLEWMNGVDPAYAQPSSRPQPSAIQRVRFDESHLTAIRFYTARTGRDIVGELRRGYAGASSDSARFVFATMLRGLGAFTLTEAEIADAFTSGVAARIALAQQTLPAEFDQRAVRMTDADAVSLIDHVIAATVDGTPLWRPLTPAIGRAMDLPGVHAVMNRLFVQGDSLPAAVRQKWASRVTIVDSREWANRDLPPRRRALPAGAGSCLGSLCARRGQHLRTNRASCGRGTAGVRGRRGVLLDASEQRVGAGGPVRVDHVSGDRGAQIEVEPRTLRHIDRPRRSWRASIQR